MKIGIRFGHMFSGADTGAVGILSETDVNRQYGTSTIKYLQQAGHEVINCTPETAISLEDSLAQGVNTANENGCELFVSLHANSYNGQAYGCEVLYFPTSGDGKDYAERISNSISNNCGYYNRGAKSDVRGLYELKYTNMPAVIVEPFFVDNPADCDKFVPDFLGKAIAEGITGNVIQDPIPVPEPEPEAIVDWKEILNKVAANPAEWQNAIDVAVNAANADGDMGALEIFKYLPVLIEKVYNSR